VLHLLSNIVYEVAHNSIEPEDMEVICDSKDESVALHAAQKQHDCSEPGA